MQADPFSGELRLLAELVDERVLAVLCLPEGIPDVVIQPLTVGRDPLLPPALEADEPSLKFDHQHAIYRVREDEIRLAVAEHRRGCRG